MLTAGGWTQRAEQNRQAAGRHASSAARPPTTWALLAPYSTTVGLLTARLGAGGKGRTVAVTLCTAVTVPTHAVSTICTWYLRQGIGRPATERICQRSKEWEQSGRGIVPYSTFVGMHSPLKLEIGGKRPGKGRGRGRREENCGKGGNGYDAREEDEFKAKAEVKAEAKQSRALVTNGQHEQSSVIQAEQSRAGQAQNNNKQRAKARAQEVLPYWYLVNMLSVDRKSRGWRAVHCA